MGLKVDPEFKSLIPSLTEDERDELRASLQAEGCRDAIVTWNGTIIDGHNRYELCSELGIPFKTIEREFDDRDSVTLWMVKNQFARRNLNSHARANLARIAKPIIAAKAKAQQGTRTDIRQNSDESLPISTKHELAALAGVSHDTIHKVEVIEDAAPDVIKEKARDGDISTRRAYMLTKALDGAPSDVIRLFELYDIDEPEKVPLFIRLHKSRGNSHSNGTFDGLLTSGYIQPGDGHDAVYIGEPLKKLETAVAIIHETHRMEAIKRERQEKIQAAECMALDDRFRLEVRDIHHAIEYIMPSSVDLIITDPPYGKDSVPLHKPLAQLAAHALKPGGSLLVMVGQSYLPDIMRLMTPYINYHWMLSYQTPGGQSAQLWARNVNTFWKPVIWFVKGGYNDKWVGDVTKSAPNDNDKKWHKWGQSLSGIRDLMGRFVAPGMTIFDPFVGGGSVAIIANETGCKFIGFDIDSQQVALTKARLLEAVS
jgi:site-specific DNA-methyltransferase (adenine-specific)